MDRMTLIPAIDLIHGRCVRLEQGDFERQTDYDFDPVERACSYAEAGATIIHLVDLDGARAGHPCQLDLIAEIVAACGIPVQCGGGLRSRQNVDAALATGVSRVVVGSALIADRELGGQWLDELGSERLVAALDAQPGASGFRLASAGWQQQTDQDLFEALDFWSQRGLRHTLITDISRDGRMAGPSVDLYREVSMRCPQLAVQASGGVRDGQDLEALQQAGADGAIVGKALLDGRLNLAEALEV